MYSGSQLLAYRTQMGCTHLRFSLPSGYKDLHVIVIRADRKWMGWMGYLHSKELIYS